MSASSPLRFTAAGLGLVLVAWSAAAGCGNGGTTSTTATGSGPTGSGPTGSGTTGSGGAGSGGASSATSGTGGQKFATCDACLAGTCKAELAACDDACHAIQACLDAVCAHLSSTMSPDEGACQVHCQMLHPSGKAAHLGVVNCAQMPGCQPPCKGYSFDYDVCAKAENAGACKPALDACNASNDCISYQACASTCTTLTACLACATVPGGDAGEKLYEASQLCVEKKCIADGWLSSI